MKMAGRGVFAGMIVGAVLSSAAADTVKIGWAEVDVTPPLTSPLTIPAISRAVSEICFISFPDLLFWLLVEKFFQFRLSA